MDNVSHAIIGSAVVAMMPPGTHPAVMLGVIIGSETPDLDYIIRMVGGPVAYLKYHRGPTHGLITLPLQAAIVAVVLRLVWPDAPLVPLFLWTLVGCLSHVLFDFGNDYGTQGLWPFSGRRIAQDLIPIVDVRLLALIGAGWLVDRIWPGHRQLVFLGVWLLIAAYVWLLARLHTRAVELVRARYDLSEACGTAAACGSGWRPERLSVHPMLLSMNAWRYVVQMPGEYHVGRVWVRERRVSQPEQTRNQMDQVVQASLQSEIVSTFADWVRRPRVEVEQLQGRYQVRWSEARYEVDGFAPFAVYAWLDQDLELIDHGLGAQRPASIGRASLKRRLWQELGRQES